MRIDFGTAGYMEVDVTDDGKISVVLSAQDGKDPKKKIVNSAFISIEQFEKIAEVISQKFPKK
jgi:hypothetical protein